MNKKQYSWSALILLSLIAMGGSFQKAYAQLDCPPPTGLKDAFAKQHITIGAGPTFLYGDIVNNNRVGFAAQGKYDYKIYRGLLVGGEIQLGNLKAQGDSTGDGSIDRRHVDNFYKMVGLNLTVYPFHYINDEVWGRSESIANKILNGIYVGVGLGMAFNDYKSIYRDTSNYEPVFDEDSEEVISDELGKPAYKKKTTSFLAPTLNLGLAFPLSNTFNRKSGVFSVVANAQFSFAGNDMLDGYDPQVGANKSNDIYSLYTLGLRYSF